MGKFSMTRSHYTYSGRKIDYGAVGRDVGNAMNTPYARWQLSQTPVLGDFYKAADQEKYYADYLRNIGKYDSGWSFVKYPALLGGTTWMGASINAMSTVPNMIISRNLMRMYR